MIDPNSRLRLQTTNQPTRRLGMFAPSFLMRGGLVRIAMVGPRPNHFHDRDQVKSGSQSSQPILECRESNMYSSCSLGTGKTKVRRIFPLQLQLQRPALASLTPRMISIHVPSKSVKYDLNAQPAADPVPSHPSFNQLSSGHVQTRTTCCVVMMKYHHYDS